VQVPEVEICTPLFLSRQPEGGKMRKLDAEELQKRRWIRALEIARVLFNDEGYFDDYLCQIEQFIREKATMPGGEMRAERAQAITEAKARAPEQLKLGV